MLRLVRRLHFLSVLILSRLSRRRSPLFRPLRPSSRKRRSKRLPVSSSPAAVVQARCPSPQRPTRALSPSFSQSALQRPLLRDRRSSSLPRRCPPRQAQAQLSLPSLRQARRHRQLPLPLRCPHRHPLLMRYLYVAMSSSATLASPNRFTGCRAKRNATDDYFAGYGFYSVYGHQPLHLDQLLWACGSGLRRSVKPCCCRTRAGVKSEHHVIDTCARFLRDRKGACGQAQSSSVLLKSLG